MSGPHFGGTNLAIAEAAACIQARGQIGNSNEFASAIDGLLDPEQSWVTGQVIGVDGGLSRIRSRSGCGI